MGMDAQKLVLLLKKQGVSNADIAGRLGCSSAYVTKIANGSRKNPSYKYMDTLRVMFNEREAQSDR